MDRAVVRCVPWESKLTISFVLDGSNKQMLRDQTEELGKALARIANSIIKGQGKAKKSKKNKGAPTDAQEPATAVRLYYNGDFVAGDAINSDAWQDGAVLHVGDSKYTVERNPPTFTTAELPASLLAGFPVCPKLKIEFGDLKDCRFKWFKESKSGAGDEERRGETDWTEAGSERAGPGTCTFDNRHMYTNKVTDDTAIRVVSYNILADVYAQTDLSKTVLYPYCTPYALELDYRQSLIKKELSGYNADIICLQEVDKNVFADSLSPALDAFGFDGVFRIKEKQHEGLATYYRRSKFKLLSQHDIMLSEALKSDPIHEELLDRVSSNPALKEKVVQRSTTLQKICVANTHLYWHPKGGNVRLVQMSVALKQLQQVITQSYPDASLLFSGDFNSTPSSGVYQLVSQGALPSTHPDWSSNGPDELCPMEVSNPFQLSSACGEPAYTNYVGGFHGCLDYIFMDPRVLQVEQMIPLPSHQEITTCQALPSVSHPSDHIALVCDLRWK
ncbi:unnamed protein product [Coregonus sp. 'balchen']|nr:unnamed protein product [Coregonus sp. 'balchen']